VQIGEVAVLLVDVEAVAGEQLVGDDEADVANGKIVDEAPVRAVEERRGGERARLAELERLAEEAQRQARVDDVLDEDHVAALELRVQVLEEPDPARPAELRVCAEARELDEVDRMENRNRPREVGEEDDRRLERGDEQRLPAFVVARDPGAELADARLNLFRSEVDLADPRVFDYEAIGSLNRSARRATSRL
jgi:hypothetical protein